MPIRYQVACPQWYRPQIALSVHSTARISTQSPCETISNPLPLRASISRYGRWADGKPERPASPKRKRAEKRIGGNFPRCHSFAAASHRPPAESACMLASTLVVELVVVTTVLEVVLGDHLVVAGEAVGGEHGEDYGDTMTRKSSSRPGMPYSAVSMMT